MSGIGNIGWLRWGGFRGWTVVLFTGIVSIGNYAWRLLYTVVGKITTPEDVHILSLVPGIVTLHREGEFTLLIS